jgi:general secretion pathway protein J
MTRRLRGLTLIELLVTLVIFSLLVALGYGGLERLVDGAARLRDEQQAWRELAQFFLRLDEDLAHARSRPVRDAGGAPLPAFAARPFDARASAAPSLELTRGGELHYDRAPRSDLRRVGYRLREGTLSRLAWSSLDRAPGSEPLEAPLLEGVEALELRFYSQRGGWSDFWPRPGASGDDALPRAVELTVTLQRLGRFRRVFLVAQ